MDFIKEIRNEPQFSSIKGSEITLHGPSGTAISPTKPISVLILGNSVESPLRVQVSALPLTTIKPVSDPGLTLFWNSLRKMKPENGFLKFDVRPEFHSRKIEGALYSKGL